MDYSIVRKQDLITAPLTQTATYEGYLYRASVSFFWVDLPPGGSVRLHRHPCEEIFIIQQGHVTFTIATTTLEAKTGDIIMVSPNVPHKFHNSGEGNLQQIDILPQREIITEWLEDE